MRRIGLTIAFLALVAGIGLGAVGCTWTETRQDFPANAVIPPHPDH